MSRSCGYFRIDLGNKQFVDMLNMPSLNADKCASIALAIWFWPELLNQDVFKVNINDPTKYVSDFVSHKWLQPKLWNQIQDKYNITKDLHNFCKTYPTNSNVFPASILFFTPEGDFLQGDLPHSVAQKLVKNRLSAADLSALCHTSPVIILLGNAVGA